MTKKQLQTKVRRLQKERRQLKRSNALLRAALLESIKISRELTQMIPQPNYNYAEGM